LKVSLVQRWNESFDASLETVLARLLTALDRLLRNRWRAPLSSPSLPQHASNSLVFGGVSASPRRDVA